MKKLAVVLVLLLPEFSYWLGAKFSATPAPGGTCGVLVLGSNGRRMQEHRVAAAVETMRQAGCVVMVLSGGAPHSTTVEADDMAELARAAGIPETRILVEREARNTWENVRFSANALGAYDRIYVVSDSLHAYRGRRYLCRQQPGLCAKTFPVGRYRFGEMYVSKVKGLFHESGRFIVDSFRKS